MWKTKNIPQVIKKFSNPKIKMNRGFSTFFNISTVPTATTTDINIYNKYKYIKKGIKKMKLKFICPKEILMENLLTVQKAVAVKSPTPQLECFYLKAENDDIILKGNNLEISIQTQFNAEIEYNGEVLVNAKNFFDMVRLMPSGEVSVCVDDDYKVEIKNNRTKYETIAMDTEAFPQNEKEVFSYSFKIHEGKLKELVKKTYFSVANDNQNPTFKGALFEVRENLLKVVTTDTFRMSLINEEIVNTCGNYSFIIPGKSLNELIKIIGDGEEEAEILFSDKSTLIKIRNMEFSTRLIDGEFLNYEHFIPETSPIKVYAEARALREALERCSLIVTPDAKEHVKLTISDGKIDMLTESRVGKIEDSVDCAKTGADIEIGFNHKFMLDALKSIEEETVSLNFTNSLSPCIIKCDDNDSFVYLVVPVRIRESV